MLYFKSYESECKIIINNKPRISVAFVQDIYRYFWDLLTPVTSYRYFERFATFEGVITFGT